MQEEHNLNDLLKTVILTNVPLGDEKIVRLSLKRQVNFIVNHSELFEVLPNFNVNYVIPQAVLQEARLSLLVLRLFISLLLKVYPQPCIDYAELACMV